MIVILMGVAGSGKSTVGRLLAYELGWPFYDGDDYHPTINIEKMSKGQPLEDSDRLPWLSALRELVEDHSDSGKPAIVSCSALKRSYRSYLTAGRDDVLLVYLEGAYDLNRSRLEVRHDHYFNEGLLKSQYEILEVPGPDEAIIIDISKELSAIVEEITESIEAAAGTSAGNPANSSK